MEALAFQPNEAARILAILKKFKRSNGGSSLPPEEGCVKDEDRPPVRQPAR
jgi:hypothetical protein